MADGDDDHVVKEFDVFLSKALADKLYLFQYPLRPSTSSYDDSVVLEARVKPKQQKVELELALNTHSHCYDKSKGEQIALNANSEGGKPFFNSKLMDKHLLVSSLAVGCSSRYAIGMFRDGELHISPIKGILQLRPNFSYVDHGDSKGRGQVTEIAEAGDEEDEDEAKQVTVKFARPLSDRAKKAREKSFKFLQQKMDEEPWTKVLFHKFKSEASVMGRKQLSCQAPDEEVSEMHLTSKEYLKMLIPVKLENDNTKPSIGNEDVISMAQLRAMPLGDQIRTILINAKVIKFNQLLALLPTDADPAAVTRSLQQVALLVQGCWVVKSDVLYPKDSFSVHTGVSAEALCKARDYILWRFTQSASITRKEISSVVKLPQEDMKEILEHVSKMRPAKGWEFFLSYDDAFIRRYPEVVQRQQMLWDAKCQQLCKLIKSAVLVKSEVNNVLKSPTKPRQRKRTKSSQEARSDDSDREKDTTSKVSSCPNEVDVKPNLAQLNMAMKDGLLPGQKQLVERLPSVCEIKRKPVDLKIEPQPVQQNTVVIKQEPMDIEDMQTVNCGLPVEASKSCVKEEFDQERFRTELANFVREKLQTMHCLTVAELKCQLHYKLAESPPGYILGKGVSDVLLEQTIREVGGEHINMQWPVGMSEEALYVLSEANDQVNHLRKALIELYQSCHRYRKPVFKKRLEEVLGAIVSDADINRLLKDYCGLPVNGYYMLKFARVPGS